LVGAGLGVAAGLLLAPRSGRESRKRLGRWIEDMEDEGRDMLKEGRDLWERGKTAAQEKTDKIKRTLESAGGKGGRSKTTTRVRTYSATFAVGLCKGPIVGVRRISW
jgi:gas vesicle protein